MPVTLTIGIGGSVLEADLDNLQPWRTLLNCADSIGLIQDKSEAVRVELSGQRRWIAFKRTIGGCPLYAIGYQETVGGMHRQDAVIGGSNRKVLCWLRPDGSVRVE